MRIQLFYTPTAAKGGDPEWFDPPLGLLYLASYVRKLLPEIILKVTDGKMEGGIKSLDEFRSFKPDLVGVSFASPHAPAAYRFMDKLKAERPDLPVVCGGVHTSAMPEEVLSASPADIAVVGEGEVAFATIVEEFMNGKARVGEKRIVEAIPVKDLDSIPFPARDLVDIGRYSGFLQKKGKKETAVFMSRGCPYRCCFCSNPVWKAHKPWVRFRSPQNIADELQMLKEEYGVDEIRDVSDETNANLPHAKRVWDEIIRRDLKLHFKVQMTARSRNYDEELIAKLAEAGTWIAMLGIESANQETLTGIGKQITPEDVIDICELFKRYKIEVLGLFMFFLAWERDGQLRFEGVRESLNTFSFAHNLISRKLVSHIHCGPTTPFPGSPLWDTCMKYGLVPHEYIGKWDLWMDSKVRKFFLPGISPRDWTRVRIAAGMLMIRAVFSRWRALNPRAIPRLLFRGKIFFKLLLDYVRSAWSK